MHAARPVLKSRLYGLRINCLVTAATASAAATKCTTTSCAFGPTPHRYFARTSAQTPRTILIPHSKRKLIIPAATPTCTITISLAPSLSPPPHMQVSNVRRKRRSRSSYSLDQKHAATVHTLPTRRRHQHLGQAVVPHHCTHIIQCTDTLTHSHSHISPLAPHTRTHCRRMYCLHLLPLVATRCGTALRASSPPSTPCTTTSLVCELHLYYAWLSTILKIHLLAVADYDANGGWFITILPPHYPLLAVLHAPFLYDVYTLILVYISVTHM